MAQQVTMRERTDQIDEYDRLHREGWVDADLVAVLAREGITYESPARAAVVVES